MTASATNRNTQSGQTKSAHERVRVVIVGAGASGIGAAIRLRQLGIHDFIVLEKASEAGGTWRDNVYPGCSCDVPSALYSYSFAPNPEWSRAFAKQPEIKDYLQRTAEKEGVQSHLRFDTQMLRAKWNREESRWEIETSRGSYSAQILLGATGPWNEPRMPDVRGLGAFRGTAFHSARWPKGLDLTGKRVAVLGTGASAVQFVPEIQPNVRELHLFQRTPSWVLPKPDHVVPGLEKALFRTFPIAQRALRRAEYGLLEVLAFGFRHPQTLRALERVSLAHLERQVPDPKLRSALTPDFRLGCKRILLSNTYYRSLTERNVSVHTTAVSELRERSVVGENGVEKEVDVVIFGTGFHILDQPIAGLIHDGNGRSLADTWQGSPEGYLGTSIAGFPNFFLVLGPNLGTGYSSAFSVIEAQLRYVTNAIQTMTKLDLASIDVRPEVQSAYNAEIQSALKSTVYNAGGCQSYYIDENGRNSFGWPWSTSKMEAVVRDFDVRKYVTNRVDSEHAPLAKKPKSEARRSVKRRSDGYGSIDLEGCVVAITGGARGIGRATAEAFASKGALVCLGDRDLDEARESARSIGQRAHAFPLDVTSRASFAAFLQAIEQDVGPVDILVNNAGLMPLGAFVDELDRTSRTTLEVNVWGPILGMRLALPGMIARGGGHIVNVASMAGKFPIPGAAVYAASKAGLLAMTAVVREEVSSTGVSVSSVLPSAVRTGLVSGVPTGRGLPMVDPEEIAQAIVKSCETRKAEIPVPAFMGAYDAVMALTPNALVKKVLGALDTKRVLTSLDLRARAAYDDSIREQGVAIDKTGAALPS